MEHIKSVHTNLMYIIIQLRYARVGVDVHIIWSNEFGMYRSALPVIFIGVFDYVNFDWELQVQCLISIQNSTPL